METHWMQGSRLDLGPLLLKPPEPKPIARSALPPNLSPPLPRTVAASDYFRRDHKLPVPLFVPFLFCSSPRPFVRPVYAVLRLRSLEPLELRRSRVTIQHE